VKSTEIIRSVISFDPTLAVAWTPGKNELLGWEFCGKVFNVFKDFLEGGCKVLASQGFAVDSGKHRQSSQRNVDYG